MKIRFALAGLLRLREFREEQQRARLLLAKAEEERVREEVRKLKELRSGAVSTGKDEPKILGAHLRFLRECCSVLSEHEKRASARREQAAAAREEQELAYRSALRDFEVLDSFRQRQFEAFQSEERRKEQKHLDEAHLLTRSVRSGQRLPACPAGVAQDPPQPSENLPENKIGSETQLL